LGLLLQSLLLRKALKMQQDDEDRKNKIIIKGLEDKVKELEDSLKEKDKMLCSAEGSLAEAQAQNNKLGKELVDAQELLKENSNRFNQENEALKATLKVETEKNTKLSEVLRALKERCFEFASQCTTRLRSIFNSVGAVSEETSLSAEDILGALECTKKEVDVLDEVITGHGKLMCAGSFSWYSCRLHKSRMQSRKSCQQAEFQSFIIGPR
jgi:DNA repair exonuclease SbcCD ATPase subunit